MAELSTDQLQNLVDTVVIVMLENRSFDHILGHLSYRQYDVGRKVEGLRDPLNREAYENLYATQPYYPFEMRDGVLPSDLPHEREQVTRQLAHSAVTGTYQMNGFVEAYYEHTPVNWTRTPEPMGFLPPSETPMTTFLAQNFAVCDHWFAPLPTSTLPNRLMAWTGASWVDHTGQLFPPLGETILDWLTAHRVRWRVYHDGLSFFTLLGRFNDVLSEDFQPLERLAADVLTEPSGSFPQVILIEPSYGDAPHLGPDHPNDNHPPLPVGPGEHFLWLVYRALTARADRWEKTALIVVYDEHGGFFDHVPPLAIPYDPKPHATYPPFESTGVRVPAMVISPLVASRTVHNENLDHTSILQFLAERFAPEEGGYSAEVEKRRVHGITSVSKVLNLAAPRKAFPAAPSITLRSPMTWAGPRPVKTPQQILFESAAAELIEKHEPEARRQYPELWHWHATRDT